MTHADRPRAATKAEWLDRCAARFIARANVSPDDAKQLANDCWCSSGEWGDRITDDALFLARVDPENEADADMEYWGEC